jgi:phosphoglucomutase
MDKFILKNIEIWSKPPFSGEIIAEIDKLKKNKNELFDSFYKNLEFGTGGMRGLMGVGTNRLNKYTIGKNAQGICNYINENFNKKSNKVVIAYDCRNNSKFFASIVANVFSANNIKAYIFPSICPTPILSFAVKKIGCTCGIVITASHNPPEYNGFKVYWKNGGQIVPPEDRLLSNHINRIDYSEIKFEKKSDLIEKVDEEVNNEFISLCLKNGLNKKVNNRSNVKIIFTALHGTAAKIVPKLLNKAGYNSALYVKSQMNPDGNFSTVKSPNPEDVESLNLAIKLANKEDAKMVIGTDPDADRLGVAVRDYNNKIILLNGNQLMVLVFNYLLEQKSNNQKLNKKKFIASTIVSTPMVEKIAEYYNIDCKLSLTGFKWIAKMIDENPNQEFIAGGEESYGLMIGDYIRDKDSITASLVAYEMMCYYREKNSSIFNELINLYIKHGFYKEKLISIIKKGKSGKDEISKIIEKYRKNHPKSIGDSNLRFFSDYYHSQRLDIENKKIKKINLPKSNVIEFETVNGYKLILRPSGTEPKIKMYISVNAFLESKDMYDEVNDVLEKKISQIIDEINI